MHESSVRSHTWVASPVYRVLTAFPIACFSLTVLTDIAFVQTSNLLWLHFSEWLLLAGLVFGIGAALSLAIMWLSGRVTLSWPHELGGLVVLTLAAVNSFIHTADGWTAVMPYGLLTSVATLAAMVLTGWFGAWQHHND